MQTVYIIKKCEQFEKHYIEFERTSRLDHPGRYMISFGVRKGFIQLANETICLLVSTKMNMISKLRIILSSHKWIKLGFGEKNLNFLKKIGVGGLGYIPLDKLCVIGGVEKPNLRKQYNEIISDKKCQREVLSEEAFAVYR